MHLGFSLLIQYSGDLDPPLLRELYCRKTHQTSKKETTSSAFGIEGRKKKAKTLLGNEITLKHSALS